MDEELTPDDLRKTLYLSQIGDSKDWEYEEQPEGRTRPEGCDRAE